MAPATGWRPSPTRRWQISASSPVSCAGPREPAARAEAGAWSSLPRRRCPCASSNRPQIAPCWSPSSRRGRTRCQRSSARSPVSRRRRWTGTRKRRQALAGCCASSAAPPLASSLACAPGWHARSCCACRRPPIGTTREAARFGTSSSCSRENSRLWGAAARTRAREPARAGRASPQSRCARTCASACSQTAQRAGAPCARVPALRVGSPHKPPLAKQGFAPHRWAAASGQRGWRARWEQRSCRRRPCPHRPDWPRRHGPVQTRHWWFVSTHSCPQAAANEGRTSHRVVPVFF